MVKYAPPCLHHGPAYTALTKEVSEMEVAILLKLARKGKKGSGVRGKQWLKGGQQDDERGDTP